MVNVDPKTGKAETPITFSVRCQCELSTCKRKAEFVYTKNRLSIHAAGEGVILKDVDVKQLIRNLESTQGKVTS